MNQPKPLPTLYLPHGGGPWPFVEIGFGDPAQYAPLEQYLRALPKAFEGRLRAVLVISAHWEEAEATVTTGERPPLLFDYYGFPQAAYELTWPAPGDPQLAVRVRQLLTSAGIASAEAPTRGFDHGTFVPLMLAFPDGQVPVVQLSLKAGLDPAEHVRMGRALRPLRDEGVLIVGSGMSYHNMRGFLGRGRAASEAFASWLETAACSAPTEARSATLVDWQRAPAARDCHPREEHLLPLHVVLGAGEQETGSVPFSGPVLGVQVSAIQFG